MRIVSPLAALLLFACAGAQKPAADDGARARAQAAVDAPDRTPEDRALDAGRKPAETLVFLRLQPGMKVAELGAGAGYTTELLARSVAPDGVIYAQNPDLFIQRFLKTRWPDRLARPAMKNVV
ncbi:MAG TPA: SAM-dependent methyltransferase, partial [Myxococcales bacterium]|nr:SAM-dependent methyltransferase [Myxococcales bacterium]